MASVTPHPAISAPSLPALRALVADDDADLLELIGFLLRREGFVVGEANNGNDVIDLADDASEANLLITDVQMPGISGLEVLSHMRLHHPNVPVILMTSFAAEHLRARAEREGAVAVLNKPFSMTALREVVARHVRRD
jgi:CheY-like chemotaxis protein